MPDVQGFDDFDVDKALRALFRREVELHGPPAGRFQYSGPFDGPVTDIEKREAFEFAMEHWLKHDIAQSPALPRCEFEDNKCRALGAAWAMDLLLRVPAIGRAHARDLIVIKATRRFVEHINEYEADIAAYKASSDEFHDGIWRLPHQHERFCELPLRLLPYLANLRRALDFIVQFSFDPQLPEHMRGSLRRGLLTVVEATLADHAWTNDDIIAAIDDGRGGSERARKDRLWHRLDEFRARTSA